MMEPIEQADKYFEAGLSCSQSVFGAFAPGLGVESETALRIAGTFGGGMGRMGEVCGAVSGALMALGLKYATTNPEDKETKEKAYRLAQEFAARFRARNGQLRCSGLLGLDMSDPDAMAKARARGAFETQCPSFVHDAAEILREMLAET